MGHREKLMLIRVACNIGEILKISENASPPAFARPRSRVDSSKKDQIHDNWKYLINFSSKTEGDIKIKSIKIFPNLRNHADQE